MISTHVLNLQSGMPASGMVVSLEALGKDGKWHHLATAVTDSNGRIGSLVPGEGRVFRMIFSTSEYFSPNECFFPTVTVHFQVDGTGRHYHVPLLLNQFGYSTYRGS